ncbi:MAG: cytochrome P450 [Roseiflexaceae bacterium]
MAPRPPGPLSSSPLGILPEFRRDPLGTVSEAFRRFGDCVRLPGLFGQPVYLLNDPEAIRTVLVAHAGDVEKPAPLKRIFRSSFGNGLFFSEGSFWRRQRKLAQPAFHHKRIQAYADLMVQRGQNLLATWQDGQIREIRKDMSALALEIVVDALFRSTVAEQTAPIYSAMSDLGQALEQQSITNPLLALLPDWAPLPLMRRKRRASATLDAIVYRFIAEHRRSGADQGDLLAMLMQAEDERGQRMSDRQLHDEVMTVFIAGHETSAITLTWALALLAQHPEAEVRLHAELDAVLGGRPPTLDDLPHLPYTEQVVKETLRLYPPAWLLLRQTIAEVPLGPYRIAKGAQVWVCPYTMHRHPRFYPAPEAFQPERFGPDASGQDLEARLPKSAYLPFGAGPRICIGNMFALLELRLLLALVAQRFRLELLPAAPIELHAGPTLGFKQGASMRVIERKL